MEEIEKFAIDFSIWKDEMFVKQKNSDEYYPTYRALSEYEMQPYSLTQILKFYKEQL